MSFKVQEQIYVVTAVVKATDVRIDIVRIPALTNSLTVPVWLIKEGTQAGMGDYIVLEDWPTFPASPRIWLSRLNETRLNRWLNDRFNTLEEYEQIVSQVFGAMQEIAQRQSAS